MRNFRRFCLSGFIATLVLVSIDSPGQLNTAASPTESSASKLLSYQDSRYGPSTKTSGNSATKFLGWGIASRFGPEYLAKFPRQRQVSQQAITAANSLAFDSLGLELRPNIKAGYLPTGVVHADFNHDGHMDWAVSMGGDSTVWVYLGHGDGSFEVPQVVSLQGRAPINLVVSDLNEDGNPDLVLPEADSATVGVLLGRGDGTFETELQFAVPTRISAVTVADFNHDGHLDVAAGMMGDAQFGAIAILLGNGTGHLGAAQTSPSQLYGYVAPIVTGLWVGDFNHDGMPDLVVCDDNQVVGGNYVYTNNADGTFKLFDGIGWGFSAVVADFNEDGLDDIAIETGDFIYLVTGNADGSLTFDHTMRNAYGNSGGYQIVAADLNSDGHLDLAVSPQLLGSDLFYGQDSGSLATVMYGDGKGAFGPAHVYRGHSSAFAADVFDINGDGKPEIVTANQDFDDLTIYFNAGGGTYGYPKGEYIGYMRPELYANARYLNAPRSKAVITDLNSDGRPDVLAVALTPYGHDLISALQYADGTFATKKYSTLIQGTAGYGFDLMVGDFRNTGRQDVVYVLSNNAGTISSGYIFAANQGDGAFVPDPLVLTSAADFSSAASGDFNGDGKLDFAIVGGVPSAIYVFLGNGDGTFRELPPVLSGGSDPYLVYARDFTGDGILDLVVLLVQDGSRKVLLAQGIGNGTFQTPVVAISDSHPFAVGDVNGDGLADIVEFTDMWGENLVRVWLCHPGGIFTKSSEYTVPNSGGIQSDALTWLLPGRELNPPELADFDGDGKLDILVYVREQYSAGTSRVSAQFFRGAGDGNFAIEPLRFDLGADMGPSTAADIDSNGRADLIEMDGRMSSFQIIRTAATPALGLVLVGNPITANTGIVRVALPTALSSDTPVSLTTADPGITLPASIALPAGSISSDVVFSVSSRPAVDRVFTIFASTGTASASVTGTLAGLSNNAGVNLIPSYFPTFVPGEIGTIPFRALTNGGYEGDVTLSCGDIPESTACSFSSSSFHITSITHAVFSAYLDISSSAAPGRYSPSIVTTDGAATWVTPLAVNIGDFGLRVPQPTQTVTTSSSATKFQVFMDLYYDLDPNRISLTCEALPSPLVCSSSGGTSSTDLWITGIESAPHGSYPFRLVGTVGALRRTVDLTLNIADAVETLPATGITTAGAILHGAANPAGIPITVWFQYGTDSALTNSIATIGQNLGSGNVPVSVDAEISGLEPSTTYYFRLIAGNQSGSVLSFKTAPDPSVTLSLSTAQVDFGSQPVNSTSISQVVTLTSGLKTVTILGVTTAGDFKATNNCGKLDPQTNCTITISFVPTGTGTHTGTVTVQSTAVGTPHIINLSGVGTDFSLAVDGEASASVIAGSSASYKFSVTGGQSFSGTVGMSCLNLPIYATCQFSPSTLNVNGTGSQTVSLSLSTKAETHGALRTTAALAMIFLIPGLVMVRKTTRHYPMVLIISFILGLLVLGGCGSGGSGGTQPPPATRTTAPGTYTISVEAKSGNLQHVQSITLRVQ